MMHHNVEHTNTTTKDLAPMPMPMPKKSHAAGGAAALHKSSKKEAHMPDNGTTGTEVDISRNFEVYSVSQDKLFIVPCADIVSMPKGVKTTDAAAAKRLLLCPTFNPAAPDASCPLGPRCKCVHASLDNAVTHAIHVNYAYRSLDQVTFETMPAGAPIPVAPPNEQVVADHIPAHLCLKTQALQSNRRVISHCAHYYFNRTCNRGEKCFFIHAVSMTPQPEDPTRRVWGRTQALRSTDAETATATGEPSSTNANGNNKKNKKNKNKAPSSSCSDNNSKAATPSTKTLAAASAAPVATDTAATSVDNSAAPSQLNSVSSPSLPIGPLAFLPPSMSASSITATPQTRTMNKSESFLSTSSSSFQHAAMSTPTVQSPYAAAFGSSTPSYHHEQHQPQQHYYHEQQQMMASPPPPPPPPQYNGPHSLTQDQQHMMPSVTIGFSPRPGYENYDTSYDEDAFSDNDEHIEHVTYAPVLPFPSGATPVSSEDDVSMLTPNKSMSSARRRCHNPYSWTRTTICV